MKDDNVFYIIHSTIFATSTAKTLGETMIRKPIISSLCITVFGILFISNVVIADTEIFDETYDILKRHDLVPVLYRPNDSP